jgi:hypothetical protein
MNQERGKSLKTAASMTAEAVLPTLIAEALREKEVASLKQEGVQSL